MAEGFDPYHVPQQRRRDKLRFANFQLQGLLPIYDPSLYSSDFMTVGACTMGGTNNNHCGGGTACTGGGGGEGVKEELGGNFLGYAAGAGGGNFSGGGGGGSNSSTSSVTNHLMYMMDPRSSSSIQLNPSCSIQEMDPNNPFLYNNPQQSSFKFFNHGGEVVVCPPPHPAEEQLSAAGSTRIMNACSHGLSLSLSSQHHNQQSSITTTTTTSTLPLELNLQNYEHDPSIYTKKIASFSGTVNELSRNSVPLGPFTGYASVLKGSRFLGPAQQLLEEICDVGEGNYPPKLSADTVMLDPSMENIAKNVNEDSSQQSCNLGSDQRRKKSRLMLLLNEVYRRYKQYCHQMQAVVASFESVAGVKNAAPFASMAVKAMSKHFNFLRNVISDQLQQFLTEPHNNVVAQEKDIAPAPSTYDHTSSATGMFDFVQHQPVWRPQRGLPERAVTILRAWLFDHFLHPYPTDTDKLMLAKQTGLSRNQVSNWFINARVRLWKPMVEEIHMLETRQAQKSSHEEAVSNVHHDRESNQLIHAASSTTVPVSSLQTPTSSVQRIQDNNNIMSLKRGRNEPTAAEKNALLMDRRNYDQNLSAFPQVGFGVSSGGGANGGVSLTLGLQQNNSGSSTRLTDIPFSVSAARRLGLVDPNGEEYVAGGWR